MIETAIGVSIAGTLLCIAVPAFVRNLHASSFAEVTEGLGRLSAHAVQRAQRRPTEDAFPKSAPLTPELVPRGHKEVDPPGAWGHPTWIALDFQATVDGTPHAFAYGFDATLNKDESSFVAHAHADLDGDGQTSSFSVRGRAKAGAGQADPGMEVVGGLE
jgi:hypothetical protein